MFQDAPTNRCWYPGPGPAYLSARVLMHEGAGHELFTKPYRTSDGKIQRVRLACRCGSGELGILVEVTDPTPSELARLTGCGALLDG